MPSAPPVIPGPVAPATTASARTPLATLPFAAAAPQPLKAGPADGSSPAETVLRTDKALAALDQAMQRAYQAALDHASPEEAVLAREEQLQWRKDREACGGRRPCIADMTRQRTAVLQHALQQELEADAQPMPSQPVYDDQAAYEFQSAYACLKAGDLDAAAAIARALLKRYPGDLQARRLLQAAGRVGQPGPSLP